MSRDELINQINKLLYISEVEKIDIFAYMLIVSSYLYNSNITFKNEIISEFSNYICTNIHYINEEEDILKDMLISINDMIDNHSTDYLENSDEYPLYVSFLMKLNNSSLVRRTNINRVINNYCTMMNLNAFTSNNYIIGELDNYISDSEYDSIKSVFR